MCRTPPLLFLFLTRWENRLHQNYKSSLPNWQLSLHHLIGPGSGGWPTVEAQDIWRCGGWVVTCARWGLFEVDCLVCQHPKRRFHKAGVSWTYLDCLFTITQGWSHPQTSSGTYITFTCIWKWSGLVLGLGVRPDKALNFMEGCFICPVWCWSRIADSSQPLYSSLPSCFSSPFTSILLFFPLRFHPAFLSLY